MNGALFRRTLRAQRLKLIVVSTALAVWGFLLPIIYARFGSQFRELMDSGIFPEEFAKLGGGDIFTLPGSIALGFIHPIPIILTSVFSVGFSAAAVAGERQRGTLEVALARPISRRIFYLTLLAATAGVDRHGLLRHLPLNPLGVQLEARVELERRLELE